MNKKILEECVEKVDEIISILNGIVARDSASGKLIADCCYANKCLLESRRVLQTIGIELEEVGK